MKILNGGGGGGGGGGDDGSDEDDGSDDDDAFSSFNDGASDSSDSLRTTLFVGIASAFLVVTVGALCLCRKRTAGNKLFAGISMSADIENLQKNDVIQSVNTLTGDFDEDAVEIEVEVEVHGTTTI